MKLEATVRKITLKFRFDAGTSRGILKEKDAFFIILTDLENPSVKGFGEAAPLSGLSCDDLPNFEQIIHQIAADFTKLELEAFEWNIPIIISQLIPASLPSIRFAFETALLDIVNGGKRIIFPTDFTQSGSPIPINGLIWMGDIEFMKKQVKEKLAAGFTTLKFKIGAIDFDSEMSLLSELRKQFTAEHLTLRVDANGAFSAQEAPEMLRTLTQWQIHSIEQPIKQGQLANMAELCQTSPVPIALDEELIGISDYMDKKRLLKEIRPQYIILKPTLLGGFQATSEWIELAQRYEIGWWITSALESNIGLNAICQYTSTFPIDMPQGLGTGQLFENNLASPLFVENGTIQYHPSKPWELESLLE